MIIGSSLGHRRASTVKYGEKMAWIIRVLCGTPPSIIQMSPRDEWVVDEHYYLSPGARKPGTYVTCSVAFPVTSTVNHPDTVHCTGSWKRKKWVYSRLCHNTFPFFPFFCGLPQVHSTEFYTHSKAISLKKYSLKY